MELALIDRHPWTSVDRRVMKQFYKEYLIDKLHYVDNIYSGAKMVISYSVDSGIHEYHLIEYKPNSQIVKGGPITFELTPASYVDLHKSRLRLKVKLERGDSQNIGLVDLA